MNIPNLQEPRSSFVVRAALVLSLAANIFWVALIARSGAHLAATLHSASPEKSQGAGNSATLAQDKRNDSPAKLWDIYGKLGLAALRDRMRADGFPPDVVMSTIIRLVQNEGDIPPRWLERYKVPYWKSEYARRDPKQEEEERKVFQQQQDQLRELLGPMWYLTDEARLSRGTSVFGDLPSEKINALWKIKGDYNDMLVKLSSERPSDIADKVGLLQKEERADIVKTLTPDELFEYDLRNGSASYLLREQTKAMDLTEAEYRKLFPVFQATMETNQKSVAAPDFNRDKALAQLNDALEAQVLQLLGPERGAEFLQSRDPANDKLNRIVKRLDLPLSAAVAVTTTRKEISARADAVRADVVLTPEQKTAQLTALAQEAENKIGATLGPRGVAAYKQYDGKWLQTLRAGGKK